MGAVSSNPAIRVLVVEDDNAAASDLVRGLTGQGFEVELATASRDAAQCMSSRSYDAVVLDLMLAEEGGFAVLARARGRGVAPIFVLSAQAELGDRLRAFELGAADFLPKPFWIEELVARIRSRLRVSNEPSRRIVRWRAVQLDLDARTAETDGRSIALTPSEFGVLAYLVERPGRAVSRDVLASQTLASLDRPDARTVDSHVARLRRKLGPGADAIATVWGVGYRFDGAVVERDS
jgi:DNA-binding response OmpR family regulator